MIICVQAANEAAPRTGDSGIPRCRGPTIGLGQQDDTGHFQSFEQFECRRIVGAIVDQDDLEVLEALLRQAGKCTLQVLPMVEAGNHYAQQGPAFRPVNRLAEAPRQNGNSRVNTEGETCDTPSPVSSPRA
ncbi:hypothetical protein D9M68_751450 [compost metagenome]